MAQRQTRKMTDTQKEKIRQSMLRYWANIPSENDNETNPSKKDKSDEDKNERR